MNEGFAGMSFDRKKKARSEHLTPAALLGLMISIANGMI